MFNKRPIKRNPNPSKEKCNASFFIDFDLGVDFISTVKLHTHNL
jgi:hypothetical protein